jgi:general secretion pathway protein G
MQLAITQHRRHANGFTLIELLVVFTLLAMLLTIAVPRYLQIAGNSREKVRDQNIATLRDALDKFKADQGRYPTELAELVGKQYLRKLPVDPITGSSEWTPVEDPAKNFAGVYDVAPPVAVALDTPLAGDADGPTPLPPGRPAAPPTGPTPPATPTP